jgi:hypothetical protein
MTTEGTQLASFTFVVRAADSSVETTAGATAMLTHRTSGAGFGKRIQSIGAKIRIKRKVSGFLRYFEGNRARVVFEDDKGRPVEYYLPADLLAGNGVTAPQQPFELIEALRIISGDESEHFTKVKPLAPASSAQNAPLDLPEQAKEDLKHILRRLNANS